MSQASEQNVKQCAAFYGSDLARLLLGDSFHPGGTHLQTSALAGEVRKRLEKIAALLTNPTPLTLS